MVRLEQELYEADRHLERDQARLTEIAQELARDEPEWRAAEQALGEVVGALMTAEEQLNTWETEWDGFTQAAAETGRTGAGRAGDYQCAGAEPGARSRASAPPRGRGRASGGR